MLEEAGCANFYLYAIISAQVPNMIPFLFSHFPVRLHGYIILQITDFRLPMNLITVVWVFRSMLQWSQKSKPLKKSWIDPRIHWGGRRVVEICQIGPSFQQCSSLRTDVHKPSHLALSLLGSFFPIYKISVFQLSRFSFPERWFPRRGLR